MEHLFNERKLIFGVGFTLLFVSIFFHALKKEKVSVLFLLISSFFLFFFAAVSIPFLMPWDERLHALVAKNLMKHPLIPTLYDEPLFDLPYQWVNSHIWVHKQPLFLWQSMLCFMIFGVNELSFRLPGILLLIFQVYATYRSGKLLGNHTIGYCAAFLTATSFFLYGLIAGFHTLDQNDLVFMEYISLSIWAMIEYIYSEKWYWIILIGIFSGFAILTKWIVGLLVYFTWSLYLLLTYKLNIKKYLPVLFSFLISLVISIPWQVYIYVRFPVESKIEYQFNVQHFTKVLDGHVGPLSYYLDLLGANFGVLVPYVILFAFVFFYLKSSNKKLSLSLMISTILIYLFFSLAKTKMESFTMIVIIPIYISIAFFAISIFDWLTNKLHFNGLLKSLCIFLFFGILAYNRMDFDIIKNDRSFLLASGPCFDNLKNNREIFKGLKLPGNAVLFNLPGYYHIDAMFYTHFTAYNFIPDQEQLNELNKKGKIIAVFKPAHTQLPEYIKADSTAIILKDSLERCE